jgi:outer membrane protein assembly factor BamB
MRYLPPLCLLLILAAPLQATDWPQFRGPFFNGSTDETELPSSWSETENLVWTTELPGPGAGTPIVWKDRVFVSAADPEENTLLACGIDRGTGKILWQETVARGISRTHRSNFASPSPATDGELVVFFYGNGDLVAFDFAGKKLWSRNIQEEYGEFAFLWTFASSPLLYDGRLYLQVLQRDVPVDGRGLEDKKNESYILAMEPKTGKTLWRHVRPSKARAESRESFTTPIPVRWEGRESILVIGGDALTAHDPDTGTERWRWETWNPGKIGHWRHVPSPVTGDGIVLVCAPKRDPVYAIKLGGSGQLGEGAVAWVSRETREVSADVPTPAFYDGDFFILSDVRKTLTRVEPRTGKVKWMTRTPGQAKYEASPLAADGKLYLMNFDGDVVVVQADDGKILEVVEMKTTREYPVRSTISAAHGQLFIRTNRKLTCIGKN